MSTVRPPASDAARRLRVSAMLWACSAVASQAAADPDTAPMPTSAAALAATAPETGPAPAPASAPVPAPAAATTPSPATRPATAPVPASSLPAFARFSFYGLAPATAGQSRRQAEAALGKPFKPEPKPAGRAAPAAASASAPACQYQAIENHPGVRFTVAAGVLSRAETRDARYATLSGVRVGDTLDRARQAYGKRLNVGPHPYFDKGQTLSVYSPDRQFALVMESNNSGHIITLRGGRLPDVAWLEGCS